MAYYSGSVVDLVALRAALVSACVTEGWNWNGTAEVLHLGGLFLRLQVVSNHLTLLGGTGIAANALTGAAGAVSRIGRIRNVALTWPVAYEIFVFADEVYLVINYALDFYQWAAFGKSSVAGLPGTGMWFGASRCAADSLAVGITPTGSGGSQSYNVPGLFWRPASFSATSAATNIECRIHAGFESGGWAEPLNNIDMTAATGVDAAVPLIGILPNTWNSEAVLLPIRVALPRPNFRVSLVADLAHARYTRIDNYSPGEVIHLGGDRWKIFPWYRKNSAARDGGANIDHSGTLGWAIRYEGP